MDFHKFISIYSRVDTSTVHPGKLLHVGAGGGVSAYSTPSRLSRWPTFGTLELRASVHLFISTLVAVHHSVAQHQHVDGAVVSDGNVLAGRIRQLCAFTLTKELLVVSVIASICAIVHKNIDFSDIVESTVNEALMNELAYPPNSILSEFITRYPQLRTSVQEKSSSSLITPFKITAEHHV